MVVSTKSAVSRLAGETLYIGEDGSAPWRAFATAPARLEMIACRHR